MSSRKPANVHVWGRVVRVAGKGQVPRVVGEERVKRIFSAVLTETNADRGGAEETIKGRGCRREVSRMQYPFTTSSHPPLF